MDKVSINRALLTRALKSEDARQQAALALEACRGNASLAAAKLQIPRSTLRERVQRWNDDPQVSSEITARHAELTEQFSVSDSKDETSILSVSTEIRTVAEALAKAELDPALWEVKEATVNQYVVPMKLHQGFDSASGKAVRRPDADKRHVVWQVKVTVRRKAPKFITDGIEEFHRWIDSRSPVVKAVKRQKSSDPYLSEISIFDHHFGKLCWARETGQDYDLEMAARIYDQAIAELLALSTTFPIERFLLPIGQDLVHIDNWTNTTTKGTPVDADGRYAKIVAVTSQTLVRAIDKLIQVAPVDLIYVAGNHDKHVSYHVCRELAGWYRQNANVTVDIEFRKRKFYEYGVCLLGFSHGDTETNKWTKLPNLMAMEAPEAWARTKHREWHLGHVHSRAKQEYLPVREVDSVVVRTLPSLTGLDAWHYESGYISRRAAECYLWSRTAGYVGHFSVNASE